MSWKAVTAYRAIGPGTVLTVFEQPWGTGLPVRSLPAGVDLIIDFTATPAIKARVIEANATDAVIEVPDKTRWHMTPAQARDMPLPPVNVGAPSMNWIIRSQLPLQSN